MKIVLSESQYKRILREEEKEQKVLRIPGLKFFDENPWEAWQILQKILQRRGNPPYIIDGDLFLAGTPIRSLGNLQSVGGNLDLLETPLSRMYTKKQIREMVDVVGKIYM